MRTWVKKKACKYFLGGVLLGATVVVGTPGTASASTYTPGDAVAYANNWATSYNYYWPFYGDQEDCANFVSQALHAGGLPFDGMYQYDPQYYWWWSDTNTANPDWTNANDLHHYLAQYSGRAYKISVNWWGADGDPSVHPATPAAEVRGDPIFYDWTWDGTWDHVSMQVGYGTTRDNYTGNYLDQHSPFRYHTFWSGWSFNPQRYTTKFGFVHINS